MADAGSHLAEVMVFRARRNERYRAADGWLTLVERTVLETGANETALGTLWIDGDAPPRLVVPSGRAVTRGGRPVTGEVEVVVDRMGGAKKDVFELEGRSYDVFVRRGGDHVLRGRDPQAPARFAFPGFQNYPADLRWRVEATLDRLASPRMEIVSHSDGSEGEAPCIGTARFELEGAAHQLPVYREEASARLFVLFLDPTNRDETYGGGRMVYAAEPAPGQPLVLDFNLAFNPPCALNALVACPMPRADSRLEVAVRAGEKRPELGGP